MTASMILPNKDLGNKRYKPKSTLKGQAFRQRTSTNLSGSEVGRREGFITSSQGGSQPDIQKKAVLSPPAQNFRRTRLKRVSEKMRKRLVEYARVKRIWWTARLEIDGGRCQFVQLDDLRCLSVASPCPHHRAGRGKNLSVPGTFLAVCGHHHDWIHQHPNMAREMGLLKL